MTMTNEDLNLTWAKSIEIFTYDYDLACENSGISDK
jgi:hypothetical protein